MSIYLCYTGGVKTVIIKGKTTRFKGDGRRLGYPTANIDSDSSLKDGVYFGHADLDNYKNHPALIFIGTPVTMEQTGRRVEAYLLDIEDRDYYDLELDLSIEHFHRPNHKLNSIEELIEIMKADEAAARKWFKTNAYHAKKF